MMKIHKMERHHYYATIFALGFTFGFISGAYFNSQPLYQSIITGLWYAMISTTFTIIGYEVGIKRSKKR